MKTAIHDIIKSRDYVSFAELTRMIDGFDGEIAMTAGTDDNMIIWHGLSQSAFGALQELLAEKKIFVHPASWMTYMIDGLYPNLPRANRPPKGGYKKPHWVPVCFCHYPYDPKAAKKRK